MKYLKESTRSVRGKLPLGHSQVTEQLPVCRPFHTDCDRYGDREKQDPWSTGGEGSEGYPGTDSIDRSPDTRLYCSR